MKAYITSNKCLIEPLELWMALRWILENIGFEEEKIENQLLPAI